jgi:hypothetical protein
METTFEDKMKFKLKDADKINKMISIKIKYHKHNNIKNQTGSHKKGRIIPVLN